MRIALIALTFVWLVFVSGIIYTLVTKSIPWFTTLEKKSSGSNVENMIALTETDRELIRTVQQLQDRLDLLETGKIGWTQDTRISSQIDTPTTTSTAIPEDFRKRIEPTISLKMMQNLPIFSLSWVSYVSYTTYRDDEQFKIIAYVINLPYEKFLTIMRTVPKTQYSINEVKTFPFPAFYINPPKDDSKVRLVGKFSDQTVAIEMPKDKFSVLKTLLTRPETQTLSGTVNAQLPQTASGKTWTLSKTGVNTPITPIKVKLP